MRKRPTHSYGHGRRRRPVADGAPSARAVGCHRCEGGAAAPSRDGPAPGFGAAVRWPWSVPRSFPNGPLGLCADNTAVTRSPGAVASWPRIPLKRQPGDLPTNLLQVRASSPSDPVSPDGQWPKAIRIAASPMNSNSGSGNNAEAPSCIRPPRPAISRLDDLHCSSSLDCYG